jgi:hypothetical protein
LGCTTREPSGWDFIDGPCQIAWTARAGNEGPKNLTMLGLATPMGLAKPDSRFAANPGQSRMQLMRRNHDQEQGLTLGSASPQRPSQRDEAARPREERRKGTKAAKTKP